MTGQSYLNFTLEFNLTIRQWDMVIRYDFDTQVWRKLQVVDAFGCS
ncbi:MAG: hypothetical protein RID09_13650 [Coleofasciculus sp. G1-WW12-02]